MTGQILAKLTAREKFMGPFSASQHGLDNSVDEKEYGQDSQLDLPRLDHWQLKFDHNNIAWLLFDKKR